MIYIFGIFSICSVCLMMLEYNEYKTNMTDNFGFPPEVVNAAVQAMNNNQGFEWSATAPDGEKTKTKRLNIGTKECNPPESSEN